MGARAVWKPPKELAHTLANKTGSAPRQKKINQSLPTTLSDRLSSQEVLLRGRWVPPTAEAQAVPRSIGASTCEPPAFYSAKPR